MTDDATREYFDTVSDRWEEISRGFFGEGVRQAAIRAAELAAGARVADVGTGSGFLAAAALAAGARVIGIDSSPRMIEHVQSRFAGQAFEGRCADIESLPLDDNELDAILANMVLHHAPDPPRAIREMARALKPNGRLVITDADTHTHEWLRAGQHDRWLGFDRRDVKRWFHDANLAQVVVVDTNEVCSPTAECGSKAAISIFLACGRKRA